MFVDRIQLTLTAGRGGNGSVRWTRRKYLPKGGPCGGNGGDGGSVEIVADPQLISLEKLSDERVQSAESGQIGSGEKSRGRNGESLVVRVPCGTLIREVGTGRILADLAESHQRLILCKGGRGGRGNATFKTSTRRAPYLSTGGQPGESLDVELELKSIADIGLVGFPSAGKSSLLNALTGARASIGAYPFTTKAPNLGTFHTSWGRSLRIADIPGIGPKAHLNKGLGLAFLRHIERTKLLVFVLDSSGTEERTPWRDFAILQDELRYFNPLLLERPKCIALNKADLVEGAAAEFARRTAVDSKLICEVSALTKKGLVNLRQLLKLAIVSALE